MNVADTVIVHGWLQALRLDYEPFVKMMPTMITIDNLFRDAGSMKLVKSDIPTFPPWVVACYVCANGSGDVRPASIIHDSTTVETNLDWRGFLLLVERTPEMRDAIDVVARLGQEAQQVRYVGEHYARYLELLKQSDVVDHVLALQTRRARRLDGRAERAPDDAVELETARGRHLSKRERG